MAVEDVEKMAPPGGVMKIVVEVEIYSSVIDTKRVVLTKTLFLSAII